VGLRVAALFDVHGRPRPSECLERAESFGDRAHFLRGNCERLVLDGASSEHAWARVWWALLGPDVELRTTAYDAERAIEAASAFVPEVSGFAKWLRETPSYELRVSSLA
jgi:hypothetical protein